MSQGMEKSRSSISGLEFRVLTREISTLLTGRYVSNIYSLGESQLIRLRRPGGAEDQASEATLVVSPKLGAWITERPARSETTEFTSGLRSHLLRCTLAGASQFDLDRVLTLEFEGRGQEGTQRLVLEMMPPGDLLLTSADGKILLALREVRTSARRLVKGSSYSPPRQTRASLDTLVRDDLEEAFRREKTLGRALGRGLSLPRRYVDEILDRASRGQEDSTELSDAAVDEIMAVIGEMMAGIEESPTPCLVSTGESSVEVMVTLPKSRRVVESSPTLSPLLDKLFSDDLMSPGEGSFSRAPSGGKSEAKPDAHERRLEEYKATIASLEAKRGGLSKLSADLREVAFQVSAASDPETALETAKASKMVPEDAHASLEAASKKGSASVSSAVFDRAKRAEREIREVDTAIEGLRSKLKKEQAREGAARPVAISLTKAKKEWYEKFRWFFTTEGRLAIGGRDAQSNATLVRRHLQEGDTVFHADLFGSPFFVLKGGKDQKDGEVREVARATVSFSSAWKTGLGAADAYWVTPEQVASAGPSGEYLAHGSFAIKGKKNFVTKNPVEIAVGIDELGRVVSGPEDSIMKVARGHVTLVPSKDKASDTAKKVLHELAAFSDAGVSRSVDDVLRMLPAGGGRVIRRRADNKQDPSR